MGGGRGGAETAVVARADEADDAADAADAARRAPKAAVADSEPGPSRRVRQRGHHEGSPASRAPQLGHWSIGTVSVDPCPKLSLDS
jgi:hypothetical protein